jgi:hypothetical protein
VSLNAHSKQPTEADGLTWSEDHVEILGHNERLLRAVLVCQDIPYLCRDLDGDCANIVHGINRYLVSEVPPFAGQLDQSHLRSLLEGELQHLLRDNTLTQYCKQTQHNRQLVQSSGTHHR